MRLLPVVCLLGCDEPVAESEGETASGEVTVATDYPARDGCTYDIEYDLDADGTANYEVHYRFGVDDLIEEYWYSYPEKDEETLKSVEYDANGCATMTDYASHTLDDDTAYIMTCACDEFGEPTECTYTVAGEDGYTLEYAYDSEYEGEDNLLVWQEMVVFYKGDVISWYDYTFGYDDEGRLAEEFIEGEDGPWYGAAWTWHADDRLKTEHIEVYGEDGYTSDRVNTFDEYDRYLASEYQSDLDGGDAYRVDRTWYDAIYQLSTYLFDDMNDGTADVEYTYACSETWPWSCDVTQDGSTDEEDPRERDGTVDHTYTFVWACP